MEGSKWHGDGAVAKLTHSVLSLNPSSSTFLNKFSHPTRVNQSANTSAAYKLPSSADSTHIPLTPPVL